ncbi:MAG: MFS transporter, partial [Victivallales bacterium]
MKLSEYLSGHHALRAFHHKNYRLFFTGQGVSLMGTWIQQIAVSWLVYRLTNSALLLGVAGFAAQIPVFFLTPVGGVCADRWNRRWILLTTQFMSMLLAFILSLLFFKGNIVVWQVISISFLLGCVNAFDMPARHSFVNDIVDGRDDVGNAIALNSFLFNSARLIGPAIAGMIIARSSEGACFLINAFSFIAVLIALSAMDTDEIRILEVKRQHPLKELFEGLKYAAGFSRIRNILIFGAVTGLVGMPYSVLMPVYAKDVLHGNSETLGFLTGAAGFGAIAGALFLARRKNSEGLGNIISGSCII